MRLIRMRGIAVMLALLLVPIVAPALARSGPESVAPLAARLAPAVVNISISRPIDSGAGEPFPTAPDGSPLKDYLDENNPNSGGTEDELMLARSLGSGFLISADGIVVTNNHVIAGANSIEVFLGDGTRLKASVVGVDEKTDLAVLKVAAPRPLPFVEFGDSDTAVVGDWVMAIGNPFGLGGSVTLGIVSARNRDIQSGPYDQFIQTDAAINQGNSGGPLFDMSGKVIGINTAILAQGGTALGIGFAVPVNLARPVIEQLRRFGETRRGWLGVGIQEVSEDIRLSLNLPSTDGALVIDVMKGGPSDGVVEPGDVILRFDGHRVATLRDLPRLAAEGEVGKRVPLDIRRGGKPLTVMVTLGRLEESQAVAAAPAGAAVPPVPLPDTLDALVGFEAVPLDDAARARYGFAPEVTGVLVSSVVPGSDAETKGLAPGNVIVEINQQAVDSVAVLTDRIRAAREAGRPAVLFRVSEGSGAARYIAIRLY